VQAGGLPTTMASACGASASRRLDRPTHRPGAGRLRGRSNDEGSHRPTRSAFPLPAVKATPVRETSQRNPHSKGGAWAATAKASALDWNHRARAAQLPAQGWHPGRARFARRVPPRRPTGEGQPTGSRLRFS
jgi:hypothetical protein